MQKNVQNGGAMKIRKLLVAGVIVIALGAMVLGGCGKKSGEGKMKSTEVASMSVSGTSSTVNVGTKSTENEVSGNSQTVQSNSTPISDNSDKNQNNDLGQYGPGSSTPVMPMSKPNSKNIRALYLTGWTIGRQSKLDHYVWLAKHSSINAYVIDVKGDDGFVAYKSNIPMVKALKNSENAYNVQKVVSTLHANGIYVIGRVVCFKDPQLSKKRPDLAVQDKKGGLFYSKSNGKMITWLNPADKDSWPYLVAIAKEALANGFDEIQFDYVRFPNDGKTKNMVFPGLTGPRYQVINNFLAYARGQMPNAVLSADVFGIICVSPGDTENIGQNLDTIGKNVNYLSPMIYPSHYALGQVINGKAYAKPDLQPYPVVYNSLIQAQNRMNKISNYGATMRPYLQDFSASWIGAGNYQRYGVAQVKAQIQATYDAGYTGWIMWNANNRYTEAAFQ